MHVCMYACIYVSLYLCIYVSMYGCMYVWMYGMYVCMMRVFFPWCHVFPLEDTKSKKTCIQGEKLWHQGEKVCMYVGMHVWN